MQRLTASVLAGSIGFSLGLAVHHAMTDDYFAELQLIRRQVKQDFDLRCVKDDVVVMSVALPVWTSPFTVEVVLLPHVSVGALQSERYQAENRILESRIEQLENDLQVAREAVRTTLTLAADDVQAARQAERHADQDLQMVENVLNAVKKRCDEREKDLLSEIARLNAELVSSRDELQRRRLQTINEREEERERNRRRWILGFPW